MSNGSDVDGILERLRREREARMEPHEQVSAAALLLSHFGAEEAARRLGVSVQHLGNLARVRRQLSPKAWAIFVSEGSDARLKNWIKIAAAADRRAQLEAARRERSAAGPPGVARPEGCEELAVGTR